LLFHVRDRVRKAKEAVGRQRHRGRDNGRKKRECRRPLRDLKVCYMRMRMRATA
jgi:hypothetical protein